LVKGTVIKFYVLNREKKWTYNTGNDFNFN